MYNSSMYQLGLLDGYGSGTRHSSCFHQLKLENELEVAIDNDGLLASLENAVTDWTKKLGFSELDWKKVRDCTKDCAPSLGIHCLGFADKQSLREAYDEYSDEEEGDVRVSGSRSSSSSSGKQPSPPPPPPPIVAAARKPRGSIVDDAGLGGGVSFKRGPGVRESSAIMRQQCPTCHTRRSECFRDGDWACAHCGEHNGHLDEVCRRDRCGRPKKSLAASPEPDRPTKKQLISTWCRSCLKPKAECYKRLDWACPHCDNHNYARKQVWGGNKIS